MTITSSQIIEDSKQADGRRWVTEQHTDSVGKHHRVTYLAESGFDIEARMNSRVASMNQKLIDTEIAEYLSRIEQGLNVVGETYIETTQTYRALQFLIWAKGMVQSKTLEPLRYAYKVTELYTETQINNLLSGTQFANKADKIKIWEGKLKDMDTAMTESETTAGEV